MDSKPDAVNCVLSTPEVRQMIMKYLDVMSLLHCRLVSKPWNATASDVLKGRPLWIKREWDSETFSRLYNCVESSTNFPFSRLDLSILSAKRNASVNFKKAAKFFTKFGMIFTHLRAHDRAMVNVKMIEKMLQSLLRKTSELQYLELGNLPTCTDGPEFCLSSLRTLNIGRLCEEGDSSALEKIILAAPKLDEIQNVKCSSALQMAAIRKTKKLCKVSSMTIDDFIRIPICSKLAANPPQLTALTVKIKKTDSRRCLTALRAILVGSQNTLKKLEICEFPEQLDDLPVFHKLEELHLVVRERYPTSAVLPHLSDRCFPKLTMIRLDGTYDGQSMIMDSEITEEFIREHFWEVCETRFETVDKLELESYCNRNAMKYLAKIFPRVTYVRLNYHKCHYGRALHRNLDDVWFLDAFPSLSHLNIINFPFRLGIMDTFLTGIPCNIVERLRFAPKEVLSPCMSQILRTQGNILQIKNLKELAIAAIPSPSRRVKPSIENPFMTEVSIWYALELIPGLRTTILFCRKKRPGAIHEPVKELLEGVEPAKKYLTIDQCHCAN